MSPLERMIDRLAQIFIAFGVVGLFLAFMMLGQK